MGKLAIPSTYLTLLHSSAIDSAMFETTSTTSFFLGHDQLEGRPCDPNGFYRGLPASCHHGSSCVFIQGYAPVLGFPWDPRNPSSCVFIQGCAPVLGFSWVPRNPRSCVFIQGCAPVLGFSQEVCPDPLCVFIQGCAPV